MAEYRTTACRALGHPEFCVSLPDLVPLDADWLLNYFASAVQSGERFAAGETVQIGWMLVMLRSGGAGDLEVWEPRFDAFPIQWTQGATNTLRLLTLQKSVCELFGCEPDFPSLLQIGVASTDFLVGGETFSMSRETPSENQSGWFFATLDGEVTEENGELQSLFQIALGRTAILPFLALPPDTVVVKTKDTIEVTVGDQTRSSRDTPLLQKLLESSVFI